MSTAEREVATQAQAPRKAPTADDLAAAVVLSLHRLVKQATLYASDNEAQVRAIDLACKAANVYGRRMGANPTLYFTDRSVFVGGRLMRGGRSVYNSALELGKFLERFGVDEMAIGYDVTTEDLEAFQSAVREALTNKGESPAKRQYARIRLRRGKNPADRDNELSPEERVLRVYASAVVVMRRFLEAVLQGRQQLPQQVRRVAMQLSDLSAIETPAFLGGLAINNMQHDHAARAVNSALIALGMARQLTQNRPLLARIAMSAMLFDVGLPRVAGAGPTGEGRVGSAMPRIGIDQVAELPAATAASCWVLGGFSPAALTQTTLVYEALSLTHAEQVQPAYRGLRHPTLPARIVGAARRLTALLANLNKELSPDQAICQMLREAREDADRTAVRLLIAALGVFPTGSMVQLSNGQIAQVVAVPDDPLRFATPVVRPVVDAAGGRVMHPEDIDLAAGRGENAIHISRVVEVGDGTQVQQLSPAEQALSAGALDQPAAEPPPPPAAPAHASREPAAVSSQPPVPPSPRVTYQDVIESPTGIVRAATEQRIAGTEEFELELEDEQHEVAEEEDDDVPSMLLDALIQPASEQDGATAVFARDQGTDLADFITKLAQRAEPEPDDDDELDVATPPRATSQPGEPPPHLDTRAPIATPLPTDRQPIATPMPARRQPIATPFQPERAPIATPMPPERRPIATPYIPEPGEEDEDVTPPRPSSAGAEPSRPDARAPIATPEPASARSPQPRPVRATDGEEEAPLSVDWLRPKIAGKRPKAQGVFTKTPLVHLLIYALDQQLTGTMIIVAPDRAAYALYFDGGVPAKVRTGKPVAPLDRVLLDFGVLSEDVLQKSLLRVSRDRVLHGQYLVDHDFLDPEGLEAALKWQLLRKVTHMLALPKACRYAYYDGVNLIDDYGGPELNHVEPLLLIMTGVRLMGRDPVVEQTLSRLGDMPLRLQREAPTSRLGLKERERKVVDALRARPQPLREIVARNVAQERVVHMMIYALMITRSLNLGSNQRPPAGHGTPAIVMPPIGSRAPRSISAPSSARPATSVAPSSPHTSSARRPQPASGPSPDSVSPIVVPSSHPGDVATSNRRGASTGRAAPRHGTSTSRSQPTARRVRPSHPNAAAPASVQRITHAGKQSRSTPSPSSKKPDVGRLAARGSLTREDINQFHDQIAEMTHYEILGVAPKATKDAIQQAYFALAKTWHPDRLPPELRDLRAQVAKIFARMNDASQTLGTATKRQEYDQVLAAGGGTAKDRELVEKAVDSAMLFQKAEVLLKMGNKAEAHELLRRAVRADPDQPEYTTLLAWVQADNRGNPPGMSEGKESNFYREEIAMLSAVIAQEPDYERALFYRGMLLKRSGMLSKALVDFKKAAQLNPRNVDAKRELRLHDMRKKKDSKGGLFGKLFGSDD